MNTQKKQAYIRLENSFLEFENLICQGSTSTTPFEDGGELFGEWE